MSKSIKKSTLTLILTISLLSACSAKEEIVEAFIPPGGFSKISKTVNQPEALVRSKLVKALSDKKIAIQSGSSSGEIILSKEIDIEDSPCGSYPSDSAPFECIVSFKFELKSLTPVASSISGTYTEICPEYSTDEIECAGSNAEKILSDIMKDI